MSILSAEYDYDMDIAVKTAEAKEDTLLEAIEKLVSDGKYTEDEAYKLFGIDKNAVSSKGPHCFRLEKSS